jgi:hypothetical protein
VADVTSGSDRTTITLNNEEASALKHDLTILNTVGVLSPELHELAEAMGVAYVVT